jgi:hypothetical protein
MAINMMAANSCDSEHANLLDKRREQSAKTDCLNVPKIVEQILGEVEGWKYSDNA